MTGVILGLDIGTTAVKGVLLGPDGQVVRSAGHPHDLVSPQPGWAEEDPADWWTGCVSVTRQLLQAVSAACPVEMIGVTGMVPALVLLGEGGAVLRPSIQQNDARATRELAWCRERYPDAWLQARTGCGWTTQQLGSKVRWVQQHEPSVWQRVKRITGSYGYVSARLTGTWCSELNWALESGLWDAGSGGWLDGLLSLLGIPAGLLSDVRAAGDVIGQLQPDAAQALGLRPGIPVIAGAADHVAAAQAGGLRAAGDAVIKLGGAGDFLCLSERFTPVPGLFIDRDLFGQRWVINGCMATSGSLLKWFQQEFSADTPLAALDAAASGVPPGSQGLVTLPYFLGEKTPLHDPEARGTVVGLSLSHTRAHLYRSLLEGVAFAFRHHVDVLASHGVACSRFVVTDGGARSRLWRQILADVLGCQMQTLAGGEQGSAYGVAFLAGVSAGWWSPEALDEVTRTETVVEPDPHSSERYAELYGVYRDVYPALRPLYQRLARWTHDE